MTIGEPEVSSETFVGIHYGAHKLCAAFARAGGPPVAVPLDLERVEPNILFDPAHNISSLGVGFPSVLQQIGSGTVFRYAGKTYTTESLAQVSLSRAYEQISRAANALPGPTVIAVAASLSQRRRQALVNCARQAGFSNVSLVDRSIAVALGVRSDRDQSGTFIVLGLDYSECEYALARLARGRCWILGSGLDPRISGERLDALVMEDIVLALRDRQVFLGLRRYTSEHWHSFRMLAESVRLQLARQSQAQLSLSPDLAGTRNPVEIRFDASQYAVSVRRHLTETLENIGLLLEENQLERDDVDAVLLVGDDAAKPPVVNIARDAFPQKIAMIDSDQIAFGATVCAADVAGATLSASPGAGPVLREIRGLPAVDPSAVQAERINGSQFTEAISIQETPDRLPDRRTGDGGESPQGDRIEAVRALVDHGRLTEAERLLDTLSAEMGTLRDRLKSGAPSHANQLIRRGQNLVSKGTFYEAVQLSHDAFAEAPYDATVFSDMMKIHADAGLGLNRPDQYDEAIRILMCAHHHDQTDRRIRKALAERLFLHASEMHRLNNVSRAMDAAKQALHYDHKHAGANALISALMNAEEPGR